MPMIPYVVEKSGREERAMDIYSRLLQDRIIILGSAIDDSVANVIVAGFTTSENFPTTAGAYDRTHSALTVPVDGGTISSRGDIFISRLTRKN